MLDSLVRNFKRLTQAQPATELHENVLPHSLDSLAALEIDLRRRLQPFEESAALEFEYGYGAKDELTELDVILSERGHANHDLVPKIRLYFGRHLDATKNPLDYQGEEYSDNVSSRLLEAKCALLGVLDQAPGLSETARRSNAYGDVYLISARDMHALFERYNHAWVHISGKVFDDQYEGKLLRTRLLGRQLTLEFDRNNSIESGGVLVKPEPITEPFEIYNSPDSFVVTKCNHELSIKGAPQIHLPQHTIRFLER